MSQDEGHPAIPRQYDALKGGFPDFRFNLDPENRLSVGKIWRGADVGCIQSLDDQLIKRILGFSVVFGLDVSGTTGSASPHYRCRIHAL